MPAAADVASTSTNWSAVAPSGRASGMATPVDVSLCVRQYASTSASATATGWVPGSDEMIDGSSRKGAAFTSLANFDENSPKLRCWLRRSINP